MTEIPTRRLRPDDLPQEASGNGRILISVIVPYHNAERTIQRTLESLSAQIFDGTVEYILVNDGSTDRSEEIVELYLRLDTGMAERTVLTAHQFRRGSHRPTAREWKRRGASI